MLKVRCYFNLIIRLTGLIFSGVLIENKVLTYSLRAKSLESKYFPFNFKCLNRIML